MALRLYVNPKAALPIYQQIIEQIKSATASGLLLPDQQLPSVRELAGELAINPNTVARAYSMLEEQGIIYRKQGVGSFIAPHSQSKQDLTSLRHKIHQLLVEAYHLQVNQTRLRNMFEEELTKWEKGRIK